MLEELFSKPVIVFGCGNTLFGDDGFGPAVIDFLLSRYRLPDSVLAVDVGTSIGDYLFDFLLAPKKPRHIFIVDAISQPHRQAGELFEPDLGEIPANKSSGFSLHQFPSVNLLREMQELAGVRVRILAVQVKCIPEAVEPGLSKEVQTAVPRACEWLLREIGTMFAPGSSGVAPGL